MTTMNLMVLGQEPRERPFANGCQAADWRASNCERCAKGFDGDGWPCDLERAIDDAAWGDGSVDRSTARRMGYADPLAYGWACGEVEWSETWKAESRRRRTLRYRARRRLHLLRAGLRRRWADWRRRRRDAFADRQFARHPGSCWAEWVIWAMNGNGERPTADSAATCDAEARADCGSCYCGRFQYERDMAGQVRPSPPAPASAT